VVTFYSFFTMKPKGRHTVRVCLGTACYVRGGKSLVDNISREWKVKEGDTTPTGASPWRRRCLGACGLGPVIVSTKMFTGESNRPDKKHTGLIHLIEEETYDKIKIEDLRRSKRGCRGDIAESGRSPGEGHGPHGNLRHRLRRPGSLNALMREIETSGIPDVMVTTRLHGLCSREPLSRWRSPERPHQV